MIASEQFQHAIAGAGLPVPEVIHGDGKLYRFSTNGKRMDQSGWYVLHDDGDVPAGAFGCWRSGLSQTWCSKDTQAMTPAERSAHQQRMQAIAQQREADKALRQQDAATAAAQRWQVAQAVAGHDYLKTKGVHAYGLKAEGDGLLIPMRDTAGVLHSLQVIAPDGSKRFQPGGRVKGCYHSIGKPAGMLVVCEGYATGASIHEATGRAVAVAFNAGNLLAVAQALHTKYPALRLVLAADDDWRTDGNPGMAKASEAALAVGGDLAVPVFPEGREGQDTDFNDLHRLAGLDAVKACIEAAGAVQREMRESPAIPGPAFPPLEDEEHRHATPHAVVLVNGADLVPRPVAWLWRDWLALGKLHILAGAPGQGKTTLALAMAATVTMGGRWPDGTPCAPGNVLVWSGEDDPADTLLPRLLASGATRGRCFFVAGARRDGEVVPFDPARDLPQLRQAVEDIGGVRLLVVDPVVSAVTGDSHKNTETRRALQPLVDLADACGCAVLGITHFAKGGQGSDPAQRVVGSVAFTAVARIVMVAAKVQGEDGNDSRVLARAKSNIGPDDGGFEYHLMQAEPLPGIQASCIAWGEAVEGSARDLLTDPNEGVDTEAQDVAGFLRGLLADGPMPAKAIFKDADGAGYTRDQVKRASIRLGVEKRKTGMGGGWEWGICSPEGSTKGAKGAKGAVLGNALPSDGAFPEGSTKGAEGSSFENVLPSHPSRSSVLPSAQPAAQDEGEDEPSAVQVAKEVL